MENEEILDFVEESFSYYEEYFSDDELSVRYFPEIDFDWEDKMHREEELRNLESEFKEIQMKKDLDGETTLSTFQGSEKFDNTLENISNTAPDFFIEEKKNEVFFFMRYIYGLNQVFMKEKFFLNSAFQTIRKRYDVFESYPHSDLREKKKESNGKRAEVIINLSRIDGPSLRKKNALCIFLMEQIKKTQKNYDYFSSEFNNDNKLNKNLESISLGNLIGNIDSISNVKNVHFDNYSRQRPKGNSILEYKELKDGKEEVEKYGSKERNKREDRLIDTIIFTSKLGLQSNSNSSRKNEKNRNEQLSLAFCFCNLEKKIKNIGIIKDTIKEAEARFMNIHLDNKKHNPCDVLLYDFCPCTPYPEPHHFPFPSYFYNSKNKIAFSDLRSNNIYDEEYGYKLNSIVGLGKAIIEVEFRELFSLYQDRKTKMQLTKPVSAFIIDTDQVTEFINKDINEEELPFNYERTGSIEDFIKDLKMQD